MTFTKHLAISCIYGTVALTFVLGHNFPEVELKQGLVKGTFDKSYNGRQILAFRGIPYAEPPIGQLRFEEPKPAKPWIGTFVASRVPNECLQYDHLNYKKPFAIHGSEDCLYINVYTPKLPKNETGDTLMDVIAYIHGGAFMFLAADLFGPKFLLDRDIVFVNFNYRLGPLGFLSTEDDVLTGNYGLKDQVLALKWIKDNIASFGGNPESVTLAGTSAGGVSVHYHMLSPLSAGLFQKAVSLSGTALCPWAQADNAREKSLIIANELGCPSNEAQLMLKCLRERPAKQIVELSSLFLPWLYVPFAPFGPVVEKSSPNAFIAQSPIDLIKSRKFNDVPWLISFASHEGLYPGAEIICDVENYKKLKYEWKDLLPHVLDYNYTVDDVDRDYIRQKIEAKYLSNTTSDTNGIIQMIGDRLFVADIVLAGLQQSPMMNSSVYAYQFSYRGKNSGTNIFCNPNDDYGVSHGDDSGFILSSALLTPSEDKNDKMMIKAMVDIWINFAATGKPTFGTNNIEWPAIKQNLPEFSFLNIKTPISAEVIKSNTIGNPEFWSLLGLKENYHKETQKEEL